MSFFLNIIGYRLNPRSCITCGISLQKFSIDYDLLKSEACDLYDCLIVLMFYDCVIVVATHYKGWK